MSISTEKNRLPARTHFFCKIQFKWQLLWLVIIYALTTSPVALARENVSIDADRQPLAKVLDEISKTTGYHVIINASYLNTPVTIHIQQRPLEEALKRILGQLNHVIIYDDTEKSIKIEIFDPDMTSGNTQNQDRPYQRYHDGNSEGPTETDFIEPDQEELSPDEEVSPGQNEDDR